MSSPHLVNMMAYIKIGEDFPKSLDPKGIKGKVTASSLSGYSKYTAQEKSNENDKKDMVHTPGGYFEYSSEREGTTKTFTNEGWKNSPSEMTQFRNYIGKIWSEEGRIAWLPIQSYKNYATATQYGLFNEEDYAEITKKSLNKFFKLTGLESENMVWWMNHHTNKDHPHVHVAFLEKVPTREQGTFSLPELRQFKRFILTEMKTRERLILGTNQTFNLHMKNLSDDRILLQDKSRLLISEREDKVLNEAILKLLSALPKEGRLQYGSSHMIPYREKIDAVVDLVLQHKDVSDAYNNLIEEFKSLDEAFSDALHEKVNNLEISEVGKIRRVIANAILAQKKYIPEDLQSTEKQEEKSLDEISKEITAYLSNNSNNFNMQKEALALLESDDYSVVLEGINFLESAEHLQDNKFIIQKLSRAYLKLGDKEVAAKHLKSAADLGSHYAAYDYAQMIKASDKDEADIYFNEAFNAIIEELETNPTNEILQYRIAQMYRFGHGVKTNINKALKIYDDLRKNHHKPSESNYIYLSIQNKKYENYNEIQELLNKRFVDGDAKAGRSLAYTYLDFDNPNFDKEMGLKYLNEFYNQTLDFDTKEVIDFYTQDYHPSNSQNYSAAKSCINLALSSIKQSDAEVKRTVKEGMQEYLETDKEKKHRELFQSL